MANTRETPAKPADFGTDIVLGTADDTKMVETVLARAGTRGGDKITDPTKYFWVDFRTPDGTPLYCEDSINWPGSETTPARNLAVIADTESRSLGIDPATGNFIPADQYEALGSTRNMVARNRAHWVVDWVTHCKQTQGSITGPHKSGQRNKSLNSVLEQQCGMWVRSTSDFEVSAQTIKEVWGDHISGHTVKPYGQVNERLHIWANTFDRNGRECVLLTGVGACDVHDNTILRHSSQIFHSESGSGQANPPFHGPWLLHNNVVLDTPDEGVGYFLHCTGGAAITEIWVQANVVKGQALQVFVDPTRALPAPGAEKVQQLYVIDNTWNRAPGGGYLLNARDITEVHYKRNKGYARKGFLLLDRGTSRGQIHTERCDVVDIDTTGIITAA